MCKAVLACNWPIKKWFSLAKLKSSLRKFYGRCHYLVDRYGICVTNDHGYVPLVHTSRFFTYSWLITGFVTRSTRRVQLMEQELLTVFFFSKVCVTRSLVLCVCFVDHCLSFCTFSFGYCVVFFFLRYKDSDYPFGIIKLVLAKCGRKHLWKVLYTGSSKENDMWAIQAQSTEPLVFSCFQWFLYYWAFHFFFTLNVLDEGYAGNASCALN